MRELHVVALSEDGKSVVLAATKGAQRGGFRVALDGPLTAAVRGEFSRPPQDQPRVSTITVKEIQARLRAGESPEEISRSEGIDLDRVQRFSGPVLSEIARVVESTRSATIVRTRRGPSVATLGESVDEHLRKAATAREDSAQWSARRLDDGRWVVEVVWQARGGPRTGRWSWDPAARTVTAADPESAALGHLETEVAPVRARPAREAAARRSPRSSTGVRTATASPAAVARAALSGKRPLPEAEAVVPPTRRPSAKPDGAAAHGSAATRRAELAARRVRGPLPSGEDDEPTYEGGASAALRDPETVQRPPVARTTVRPGARTAPEPARAPAAGDDRAADAATPVRGRRAVQEAAAAQAAADAAVAASARRPSRRTPASAAAPAPDPVAAPPAEAAAAQGTAPGPGPAPTVAATPRRARTAALVARRAAAAAAAAAETVLGAGAGDAPAGTPAGPRRPAARARPAAASAAGPADDASSSAAAASTPDAAAPAVTPPPSRTRTPTTGPDRRPRTRAAAPAGAGTATSAAPPAAPQPAAGDTDPVAVEPAAEAVPPAAPVGIPDPETQVLLPPPAEATATDEANAPGPSPAPDAAEQQLELAVGAEPPAPLLRVVPPHGGAPRTRPAREATRARASVPAWADVLLGTSARSVAPDDDEGPHQDEPQDAAQDRAQPDEPPRG